MFGSHLILHLAGPGWKLCCHQLRQGQFFLNCLACICALDCGREYWRRGVAWGSWVHACHREGIWGGCYGFFWKREWRRKIVIIIQFFQPDNTSNCQNFSFNIIWQTAMLLIMILFTLWSCVSFLCVPVSFFMCPLRKSFKKKVIKLNQASKYKYTLVTHSCIQMKFQKGFV